MDRTNVLALVNSLLKRAGNPDVPVEKREAAAAHARSVVNKRYELIGEGTAKLLLRDLDGATVGKRGSQLSGEANDPLVYNKGKRVGEFEVVDEAPPTSADLRESNDRLGISSDIPGSANFGSPGGQDAPFAVFFRDDQSGEKVRMEVRYEGMVYGKWSVKTQLGWVLLYDGMDASNDVPGSHGGQSKPFAVFFRDDRSGEKVRMEVRYEGMENGKWSVKTRMGWVLL
jgi:hypothetical protein